VRRRRAGRFQKALELLDKAHSGREV
jgi:hypothetical protein